MLVIILSWFALAIKGRPMTIQILLADNCPVRWPRRVLGWLSLTLLLTGCAIAGPESTRMPSSSPSHPGGVTIATAQATRMVAPSRTAESRPSPVNVQTTSGIPATRTGGLMDGTASASSPVPTRNRNVVVLDGPVGPVTVLAWSPDGTVLAAGAIAIHLWRADGTPIATLGGGVPAPALAWSADSHLLATGDDNGVISLYSGDGRPRANLRDNGPVASLAFAPDGQTLAAISDRHVRLINTADPHAAPKIVHQQEGRGGAWSVSNLAWSPDGTRLAVATRDGVLRTWRADGTPLAILEGCGNAAAVIGWSPDGRTLAAGTYDQKVCLWR